MVPAGAAGGAGVGAGPGAGFGAARVVALDVEEMFEDDEEADDEATATASAGAEGAGTGDTGAGTRGDRDAAAEVASAVEKAAAGEEAEEVEEVVVEAEDGVAVAPARAAIAARSRPSLPRRATFDQSTHSQHAHIQWSRRDNGYAGVPFERSRALTAEELLGGTEGQPHIVSELAIATAEIARRACLPAGSAPCRVAHEAAVYVGKAGGESAHGGSRLGGVHPTPPHLSNGVNQGVEQTQRACLPCLA